MGAKDQLKHKMRAGYRPYFHTLDKHGLLQFAEQLGIVPKHVSADPERTKERGYSKKYYAKKSAARVV